MRVKFTIAAPFNFQKYAYAVVFNTTGDGNTPRANGATNNYLGYSFAIIVSDPGSGPTANAYAFVRPNGIANQEPTLLSVNPPQQLLTIESLNSNGQNTQFSLRFSRLILSAYITPSPSPTASPTATPSASASPTASPSANPSASPSASPTPTPTPIPGLATDWQYNFFVASVGTAVNQGQLQILDSLGSFGANDSSYVNPSPLDTATSFDITINAQTPSTPFSDQSEQIVGGEIANSP